jgi:alpha-L-rhamnosidase
MWEKDLPGHTLLHSSYHYPGAWYVDGVAGIRRDPEVPGFKKFIIRIPLLTDTQISWAKAEFDSPAGLIKSHWVRSNEKTELNVSVPPNCTATIYFPEENGKTIQEKSGLSKNIGKKGGYLLYEIPAGNYQFSN